MKTQTADDGPSTSTASTPDILSNRCTSVQMSQRDKVYHRAATSSNFSKGNKEKMWTKREVHKADHIPAFSLSNAELSDKTAKDEAPITLVLKWSNQPRKPRTYLEKSLQSWFNKREKRLNCSVVRIPEDKNALLKIEPVPAAEILLKLSGEKLTLQDGTTVTVESVILDSLNLNPQTADDASTTSTSSTSDHKTEKDEAPITLMLTWSKQHRNQQIYLEKSLQTWFSRRRQGLRCDVIRILEDKNALIKIEPSPAVEILQKLCDEILTLGDDSTVTIESVVLGYPKPNPQTAHYASTTSTSSTSDVSGKRGSQNDLNPAAEISPVRGLLHLDQKSFTYYPNYSQLRGLPRLRDWSGMHKSENRSTTDGGATGGDSTEENCPICLSPFTDKESLSCKHEFCKLCLQQSEKSSGPICPVCRKVFGIIQGDQPDGTMTWMKSSAQVPGFSHFGTITITYSIPSGRQTEKHPIPGLYYTGTTRTAYLPDNKEGNEVLMLLKKAFDQKLIFTIGASRTTGYRNEVTWNDIPHKTSLYGGPDSYGYPDPNYLSRVREELKAKGIE